jgi:hypothetical protein
VQDRRLSRRIRYCRTGHEHMFAPASDNQATGP